eukprot:TRINITY_DN17887_c0_g2_i1.p1 TRINITY_DN17887_c0_g2~~TRINITY_DN17887_c0_g2_i1.p1  ORF type:complete len:440 (+),score=178.92 TRINITY_DN17887_c0_g2_i1:125-1444(+)
MLAAVLVAGLLLLLLWAVVRLRRTLPRRGGDALKKVAFIHPDLGIGGAERLVVDSATGLQQEGVQVVIYTSHHNAAHCFVETRDGTLEVVVCGDWLPRHIAGKGHVLFATLRMVWVTLYAVLLAPSTPDAYFVDQVSMPLLLIRLLCSTPALFYCHFPDKLCDSTLHAGARRSLLRRAYRFVFDTVEEACLSCTTQIVFNSGFTKQTTLDTFPSITPLVGRSTLSSILFPPVNCTNLKVKPEGSSDRLNALSGKRFAVSLNRFEKKKNVRMGLEAFLKVADEVPDLMLVLAGGYDERLPDNVACLKELRDVAASSAHSSRVLFLTSISEYEKYVLLHDAEVLLYTPSGEHFGIVPLESMYCGVPVVAVNCAGPLESIVHGTTGFLEDPTPDAFGAAMRKVLCDSHLRSQMSAAGPTHVTSKFSQEAYARALLAQLRAIA